MYKRQSEDTAELRSCVKVEVAVLGFPSLVVLMVSVDEKQHLEEWGVNTKCIRRDVTTFIQVNRFAPELKTRLSQLMLTGRGSLTLPVALWYLPLSVTP